MVPVGRIISDSGSQGIGFAPFHITCVVIGDKYIQGELQVGFTNDLS